MIYVIKIILISICINVDVVMILCQKNYSQLVLCK